MGDGKSINLWVDPWVPWIEDFKLKPRIDDYLQLPIKANHLIDRTSKVWNEDMVKEIFSLEVVQTILSIPIPHHPKQDRLIWLPDLKETFTVKSFHHVAFTQLCDGSPVNSLWKNLWKARLPERLKMLLWRIEANVIPTRENLQRRIQHIDSACIFFNAEVESSIHLFLECHFAKALRAVVGWGIKIDIAPLTSGCGCSKSLRKGALRSGKSAPTLPPFTSRSVGTSLGCPSRHPKPLVLCHVRGRLKNLHRHFEPP